LLQFILSLMQNFNPETLLTAAECLEVDSTLLPYRDKFAVRLTIYALRTLLPLAARLGCGVVELPSQEIFTWVQAQPELHQSEDEATQFATWYAQMLDAARRPLQQIAAATGRAPETLSVAEIVAWFVANAQI
jgi:hypothetical protein